MNTKVFAVVGAIFLIAFFVYLLKPREVYIQSNCDLAQSICPIEGEDFVAEIELGPKPLDPTKPFSLHINIKKGELKAVTAYLFGLKPPYLSDKVSVEKLNDKSWKGESFFPFCTRASMPWKLHLGLNAGRSLFKANYKFRVNRD